MPRRLARTLEYDTADLTVARSIRITQTLPAPDDFQFDRRLEGTETVVGDRTIIIADQGMPGSPFFSLAWTEPDGIEVEITTNGPAWDAVAEMVTSMEPVDAQRWPGTDVVEPLGRCVDVDSQYAPTAVPEGWVRYVIEAQPVGACGAGEPLLFMSLVIPGNVDGPGTLVTFVSTPATFSQMQPGEPIDVNGWPATLQESVEADGTRTPGSRSGSEPF